MAHALGWRSARALASAWAMAEALALFSSCAVLVALAVYVSFLLAPRIARAMGQTGINVMTRLMGLILAAMGVEVMADGLRQIFPALGGS